jgi:putative membrane protein
MSPQRYLSLLALPFGLLFIWLAIEPYDRSDWTLENALVLVSVLALGFSARSFPLSKVSYTLIFAFLCLHEVGAHHTYAEVPYDAFLIEHFGFSLNQTMGWERNHFDRFVHFAYGLLLAYPVREIYCRIAEARGFWSYFFPLDLVMATSMLFELFEWGAAELFGGDLGVAYLGTQGDIWDAHKDMLMATIGALIAMLLTLALNSRIQKDFAREWRDSLRVKHKQPLGEVEIRRLLDEQ